MNSFLENIFRRWPLSKRATSLLCIGIVVLVVVGGTLCLALTPLSTQSERVSIYIDRDDNIDSVCAKITQEAVPRQLSGFRLLSRMMRYDNHVRTGHYEISPESHTLDVVRALKSGRQTPVRLVVRSVRTNEMLAADLATKLDFTSAELLSILTDSASCAVYGCDTATIISLFIPNTYEVYWDISAEKFLRRMADEHHRFWTTERLAKADSLHLTPAEVATLASIIDEETANNAEKPNIAGMYLNRLRIGMPLQADPTIKFALHQFELRRIYNDLLTFPSPYNTYVHPGLPPGPIRMASVAGIDAVLNHAKHDFLYMCAKEDFSGTHNFARTYGEHLANARRYVRALNARGIK